MEKQRKNAGFSLIEMLCALLILVILVMGIGVGMDTGTKVYTDATFETESASLAGILNTSLGDILRYSIDVREVSEAERVEYGIPANVEFLFTSFDYGIQDAYFYTEMNESGSYMSVLFMKNTHNADVVELVNSGAYPNLAVSNFVITYMPKDASGATGGYFEITYKIYNVNDTSKVRNVEMIVRLMND